jgi:hypothetical protein
MTTIRTLNQIQRELDEATATRGALWHELSIHADKEKSAEVARLNERIEALWSEARAARNRVRFGEQSSIIARARAEERLERDLAKVA